MGTVKMGMEQTYCGIGELYDRIAMVLGYEDVSNLRYDCTKIDVATNIYDNIMAYYDYEKDVPDYERAMIWCCYGPKAIKELSDDTVRIEDGFITVKNEVNEDGENI